MYQSPLLIVDNDPELLAIFTRYFVRAGYAVTGVGHPRQALQAASFKSFSSGVIDLHLPEIDGLELIRRLNLLLPDFRAVLLTGDDSLSESALAGCHRPVFLRKPCSMSQLASALASSPETQLPAMV